MDFDHDRFYVSDWVVLARAGRLVISSSLSSDVVVMTSDIEPNVVSKLFLLSLYRYDGQDKDCLIVFLKRECLCSHSYCSALQRTWRLSSLDISAKSRDSCFLNILNFIMLLLCHE